MWKWFIISIGVLCVFSLVLLGLGKLLNDNEKQTTAYLNQQKQQSQPKSPLNNKKGGVIPNSKKTEIAVAANKTENTPSLNLSIIATNLTCVSDDQCVVAEAKFADATCSVAVNIIGATLLKKAKEDKSTIGQCSTYAKSHAVCRSNLCTLQ